MTTSRTEVPLDVAELRDGIDRRIAVLEQPNGTHRYDRGGIHRGVAECGDCATLHTLIWVRAALRNTGASDSGEVRDDL